MTIKVQGSHETTAQKVVSKLEVSVCWGTLKMSVRVLQILWET